MEGEKKKKRAGVSNGAIEFRRKKFGELGKEGPHPKTISHGGGSAIKCRGKADEALRTTRKSFDDQEGKLKKKKLRRIAGGKCRTEDRTEREGLTGEGKMRGDELQV